MQSSYRSQGVIRDLLMFGTMLDFAYYVIYSGSPLVKHTRGPGRPQGAANLLGCVIAVIVLSLTCSALSVAGAAGLMWVAIPVIIVFTFIAGYRLGKRYNYQKICELDERYKQMVSRGVAKLIYWITVLTILVLPVIMFNCFS